MFPNQFNVYLHDTPADSLFARADPHPSATGAFGVEQPQALAEYLLPGLPDGCARLFRQGDDMVAEERTVTVRDPVPVYPGHWTVDITPDGKAAFLPDVYGLDARQAAALNDRRRPGGRNPRVFASRNR